MQQLEPTSRHNIALHILDGSLFMSGMVFFETTTIMVAFFKHIYDNALIIGAIPALLTIGYNVPGIVSTIFAERFKKRRVFIGFFAVFQRLSMLALSLSTLLIGLFSPLPTAIVALFFYFLFPFFGGITTPAWLDFVGKTVPVTHRARTQALRNFISSLGGILLPLVIAQIFLANGFPTNYRISFFIGFIFVTCSLVAFLLIREDKDSPVISARSVSSYARTLVRLVRKNRNFTRLLISRITLGLAACGGAFFTSYSIDYYGRVDDTLIILYTFVVIFVFFAISVMADLNGSQVLITEFGDDSDRLYYTTIFSTLAGITGGVVPLAGGALLALKIINYKALFAVSALFAFSAFLL